jgi:hypothetical protein
VNGLDSLSPLGKLGDLNMGAWVAARGFVAQVNLRPSKQPNMLKKSLVHFAMRSIHGIHPTSELQPRWHG